MLFETQHTNTLTRERERERERERLIERENLTARVSFFLSLFVLLLSLERERFGSLRLCLLFI